MIGSKLVAIVAVTSAVGTAAGPLQVFILAGQSNVHIMRDSNEQLNTFACSLSVHVCVRPSMCLCVCVRARVVCCRGE